MMEDMSLTAFDMAVLFVVGVSGLFALVRGLVREGLSIAVWVLSALIAYVAFPELRSFVASYVPNVWIGDAITLIVVFLAPLICLKIVAMVLAETVPMGLFGSLDRLLGAGYGLVRGALVVSFGYLGLNAVNEPENHPVWIKEAQFLPYVRDGANLVARWIPEDMMDPENWQGLTEGGLGASPAVAKTLGPADLEQPAEADIPANTER